MATGINAKGLDALRRDLRGAKSDIDKAGELASRDAAELVATEGRDRAEGLGSTAGHVAPSVREDGTTVGLGGPAYPMAGGAEWGGRGRPTTQQFQPFTADGYFLTPAIRDNEDRIDETYADRLDDTMRKHDLL